MSLVLLFGLLVLFFLNLDDDSRLGLSLDYFFRESLYIQTSAVRVPRSSTNLLLSLSLFLIGAWRRRERLI